MGVFVTEITFDSLRQNCSYNKKETEYNLLCFF